MLTGDVAGTSKSTAESDDSWSGVEMNAAVQFFSRQRLVLKQQEWGKQKPGGVQQLSLAQSLRPVKCQAIHKKQKWQWQSLEGGESDCQVASGAVDKYKEGLKGTPGGHVCESRFKKKCGWNHEQKFKFLKFKMVLHRTSLSDVLMSDVLLAMTAGLGWRSKE